MLWLGKRSRVNLGSRDRVTVLVSLCFAGAVLAGCGSAAHHSRPIATNSGSGHWVSRRWDEPPGFISVDVPVDVEPLSPAFTCAGANRSIPIRWGSVPPHTAEVDVFLVTQHQSHGQSQFDWSLADTRPSVREIKVASVPAGSIVGRNYLGKSGYSLCPPKGQTVKYTAEVYMLPHKISVARGFDPAPVRDEAIRESIGRGAYTFSYTRSQ